MVFSGWLALLVTIPPAYVWWRLMRRGLTRRGHRRKGLCRLRHDGAVQKRPVGLDHTWPRDVLVIHNEAAGDRSQPAALLRQVLEDAGYTPRYVSTADDWRATLQEPVDLVVLIGGDGTISEAASVLSGMEVPVALLPTGTANNVAKTLGVAGDARHVVASWRDGFVLPLDVWELRTAAGDPEQFVEAVGGGMVATVIARGHELEPPTYILGSEFDRALHLLREATSTEPERAWGVEVNGVDHSASVIGLEVMNGPYLGPNIPLAPDAAPGDATLDVVFIRAGHRDHLLKRFETLASAQTKVPGALDIVKGQRVRIRPPDGVLLHLDGDLWTSAGGSDRWVEIVPAGSVNIVVGRRSDDQRVRRLEGC